MLISPVSPYELNSPRFQEPAQMIDSCTTAPGSTSLFGQIRTFAFTVGPAPIVTSLPIPPPSSARQPVLTGTGRHATGARRRGLGPEAPRPPVPELDRLT